MGRVIGVITGRSTKVYKSAGYVPRSDTYYGNVLSLAITHAGTYTFYWCAEAVTYDGYSVLYKNGSIVSASEITHSVVDRATPASYSMTCAAGDVITVCTKTGTSGGILSVPALLIAVPDNS